MKKLLLLALTLTLSFSQAVRADYNSDQAKKRKRAAESRRAQEVHPAARPVQQSARQPVGRTAQRSYPVSAQTLAGAQVGGRNRLSNQSANNQNGEGRVRPQLSTQSDNQTRFDGRNRNVDRSRTTSPAAGPGNRGSRTFNRNSFNVAKSRVVRVRHDRRWWRSHYNTTFVLFGGGYYYYDTGYWYPAYGYDPYYSNYAYNEPIYGYNNLDPGQVLENVQLALRDLGYYRGPIDGLIGPETRDALTRYQQDQGLVVTSAVDEPTLVTLGLA